MPIPLLVMLAWRNLIRNVRRSLFGLVTIASGVIGLSLAGGFIEDVFEQLGEATISAQLGHLQVAREGFREGGAGTPQAFLIDRPAQLKQLLRADPRVAEVMGRLSFSALLTAGGTDVAVEGEGVEPDPEARLGSRLQLLRGRHLRSGDTPAIVLGEGVAARLRVDVGNTVTLTAPTLEGAVNIADLEVVGVFRSFSKDFDDRAVRVALPVAFDLLQTEAVNTVVVLLGRTSDTDAVLTAVSGQLVGRGLEVRPWYVLSDFYANTRAMYAKQFGFLKLIALVLVVMSVVNSLNMSVFERIVEFGTMRVLGNRSIDVIKLIVIEGALLGVIGAAIGTALALTLAALISYVGIPMPPPPNMAGGYTARILLTPIGLLEAVALGVLSATIAAVPPAIRATRVDLAKTLQQAA